MATLGSVTLPSAPNGLPFIGKIDANGNFFNVFGYLSAPSQTDALCLEAAGNGVYYVGGKVQGTTAPVFSCTPIAPANGFYLGAFTEQPDSVPIPSITINGTLLTATPTFFGDIQWYLNGNILTGETGQTLNATQSGNYTVEYTYTTGCVGSQTSAVQTINLTSVNNVNEKDVFVVYPNPSNGLIQFKGLNKSHDIINISIKNLKGNTVFSTSTYKDNQLLDITNAASGVYFIEVITARGVTIIKVLKQ